MKNGLYALFKTEYGDFRAVLFEKDVPNSVALFVGLAQGTQPWRDTDGKIVKKPMYDNTTFYRIIPGTAIQAGSPDGTTTYNCGLTIRDEILPGIRFEGGSLAIANGGPDTGGCQFFITAGPNPSWDQKYSIFGQVVEGENIVSKMARLPEHDEHPLNPPKLISVTIERVGPMPVVKKKK